MRCVVVIQARMGSSRLPGKVLQPIGSRTMLAHVVDRCRAASGVDEVVVATTDQASDDGLAKACAALGVRVVRGPVDDVLTRFTLAAAASDADLVVRVTADCPLLDPAELSRLVALWHAEDAAGRAPDWLSNQFGERRRIPRGLDVEVVPADSLRRAAEAAVDPAEREHVTPWFYRDAERSRLLVSDPPGPDRSDLRLTVDTAEDLALVRGVVQRLGASCGIDAIADLLAEDASLRALNAGVQQKHVLDHAALRRQRVAGRLLIGRADAGHDVGVGHVTRVSALLEAWCEAGGEAVLYGAGIEGALAARCEAAGIVILDRAHMADGFDLAEMAELRGAAAVLIDSYRFGATAVEAVREVCVVAAIDDHGTALRDADVSIYQGPAARAEAMFAGAAGRLLAGPAYVLLRREVRDRIADAADAGDAEPRIVVTLGGADVGELTAPIAAALTGWLDERHVGQLDVVVGPAAPMATLHAVQALAGISRRIHVHHDVREMAKLLAGATVAVSAAGSTSWELAALGVPAVLVVVAENQEAVAACASEAGAARLARDDATAVQLARALCDDVAARAAMARAGRALVDGRGAERVIDALLDTIDARERG